MQQQRRDFLKWTAVGATGLALTRTKHAYAAWPASGALAINPAISNMRVVACLDTKMMKSTPTATTFEAENSIIDAPRVHANLDAMAMALSQKATAAEAWTTIFRSSKPWASTRVALKVNVTEPRNMPRVAVVEKFCRVLAALGVPPSNIIIYDGGPANFATNVANYRSYFSATDTSKIPGVVSNVNDALGGTTNASIPNRAAAACTADIASGKVDILINLAVNRGHIYLGRATLCMKNHFGTFVANHEEPDDYAFNINKSDAIIGGDPVRQQLCIVDSLFVNKGAGNAAPEAMPGYLVMGTFAPAVDYLTVKKIREEVLSCTHDGPAVNAYLTSFGYTTSDPVWVLVPPAAVAADAGAGGAGGGGAGSGGRSGAGGGGGNGGAGGARTSGNSGSTSGFGGAGSGGASGRGGARSGGATGSGGTRSGGATGAGGAGTGGAGGAGTSDAGGSGAGGSGSGGRGNGGAEGSGGLATGGTTASGGTTSRGGSGGGGGTMSASGGSSGRGGTSGAAASSSLGCGCGIGGGSRSTAGWSIGLVLGALATGQLRRLFLRRDGRATPPPAKSDPERESSSGG